MSIDSSTASSVRSRLRRSAVIVSVGLVAAALTLVGTVAANAAPAPTLTSSSATASVNGQLTLTAGGFAANDPLSFTLDSSPLTTYPASGRAEVTDGTGQYVGYVAVPTGTTVGSHTITVTDANSISATTTVTIVAQPTSSVSPSTSALAAYLSNGVTATFSGFAPGSTVSFGISPPGGMGDQAGPDAVVGSSGVVTFHYVPGAGSGFANVGTYYLTAGSDSFSVVAETLSFDVTANPVAAPAAPVKSTASFTG